MAYRHKVSIWVCGLFAPKGAHEWRKVNGYPVDIEGRACVIHQSSGYPGWVVSDRLSGASITGLMSFDKPEEAHYIAEQVIAHYSWDEYQTCQDKEIADSERLAGPKPTGRQRKGKVL